jgi:hypothetical protein
LLPILADKPAQGPVTVYPCQNFVCRAPLVGLDALKMALTDL